MYFKQNYKKNIFNYNYINNLIIFKIFQFIIKYNKII